MSKIKVGILKETKNPPDRRVILSPKEALQTSKDFPNIELYIQSSNNRCFSDEEYSDLGLEVCQSVAHCDILLGVKEVALNQLLDNKKYLFFSHTAKEQAYNKKLLQTILEKRIQLIDHEYLTNEKGIRLVAFGRWAGIVGAYNSLIAYGRKSGKYNLKRACDCLNLKELEEELKKVELDPVKILITGGGRVAGGAKEVLSHVKGLKQVQPEDFLNKEFPYPVFCQIEPWDYLERTDGKDFDFDFFVKNPSKHRSIFLPYTQQTDLFIACHFWDEKSPVFYTKEDMRKKDFRIKCIADVSCDINGPIPSTHRASTISEPFYGYSITEDKEVKAFDKEDITIMAVDNLPGELPRNASYDFGQALMKNVFPSLFSEDDNGVIYRASITTLEGKLNAPFKYLSTFADCKH